MMLLPTELGKFLQKNSNQSLLIKGASGTGKTYLATGIMIDFPIEKKLYITTRMKGEVIKNNYLKEEMDNIDVCDNFLKFRRMFEGVFDKVTKGKLNQEIPDNLKFTIGEWKKIVELLSDSLNGMTYKELAEKTGYSVATIRTDLEVLYVEKKVKHGEGTPLRWKSSKKIKS